MVEENAPVCVVDIPAYDAPVYDIPPTPGAISMPRTDAQLFTASPTAPPADGDAVDGGGRGAVAVLLAVAGIVAMHLIGG